MKNRREISQEIEKLKVKEYRLKRKLMDVIEDIKAYNRKIALLEVLLKNYNNNKYIIKKLRVDKGEIYWYIDTGFGDYSFNIQYSKEEYSEMDNKLFNKNNYFKTKEEAQKKLDKLIKCFYED